MFAFVIKLKKNPNQFWQLAELFHQNHGNLEEQEKISGSFEGNTWNYKEQSVANTLGPGMAQEYICQVSEQIKGRVTKNTFVNSARRIHVFWVLCLNLMNFFWTHKFGLVP